MLLDSSHHSIEDVYNIRTWQPNWIQQNDIKDKSIEKIPKVLRNFTSKFKVRPKLASNSRVYANELRKQLFKKSNKSPRKHQDISRIREKIIKDMHNHISLENASRTYKTAGDAIEVESDPLKLSETRGTSESLTCTRTQSKLIVNFTHN